MLKLDSPSNNLHMLKQISLELELLDSQIEDRKIFLGKIRSTFNNRRGFNQNRFSRHRRRFSRRGFNNNNRRFNNNSREFNNNSREFNNSRSSSMSRRNINP